MASIITGDFAEAYVRKNACKEETRKAEASTAGGVAAAATQGDKKAGASASSEKKVAKEAAAGSNKGEGGSLFGLLKKKVHPKVGGSSGAYS